MSRIRVERKVSRIREHQERQECLFTEECLRATCILRATFPKKHGRAHTLEDCSEDCPYYPKFPKVLAPEVWGTEGGYDIE